MCEGFFVNEGLESMSDRVLIKREVCCCVFSSGFRGFSLNRTESNIMRLRMDHSAWTMLDEGKRDTKFQLGTRNQSTIMKRMEPLLGLRQKKHRDLGVLLHGCIMFWGFLISGSAANGCPPFRLKVCFNRFVSAFFCLFFPIAPLSNGMRSYVICRFLLNIWICFPTTLWYLGAF